MKLTSVVSIITAVLLLRSTVIDSFEDLRYVAVIYRHGDRTPVKPYHNDPWRNESLWPEKFGQLTNIGKYQHFAFGQWMGKRFETLIGDTFDPTVMRVRSTDVDRTLMSALTNLAGMFPPTDSHSTWNVNLMWQPIPVHTVPQKDDEVLAFMKPCHNYDQEMKRVKNTPEYKDRLGNYQELMIYLSNHTGENVADYEDINSIYSVLNIETLYNFTLPEWTEAVFPEKMAEPAGYSFQIGTSTPLLARLLVGPFLKEVTSNMVKVMHYYNAQQPYHDVYYEDLDGKPPLKLNIYSAHDLNIGSVLNALGLYDGKCPQYTSTIFLELVYDIAAHTHFVKISYRNTTYNVEPVNLFIPKCGYRCPLERFVKIYDNLIPTDWKQECEQKIETDKMFMMSFTSLTLAAIILYNKLWSARLAAKARRQRLIRFIIPGIGDNRSS